MQRNTTEYNGIQQNTTEYNGIQRSATDVTEWMRLSVARMADETITDLVVLQLVQPRAVHVAGRYLGARREVRGARREARGARREPSGVRREA